MDLETLIRRTREINTDRVCENCGHDWRGEPPCPVCDHITPDDAPEPLVPESPSTVTLCGLCDGARARYDAAVAFGRIVTLVPCDEHRLMGEGRF